MAPPGVLAILETVGGEWRLRTSLGTLVNAVEKRRYLWLSLAAIVLVAALLRSFQLGTESLWMDEAASIRESRGSIAQIVADSNQPPLYFLMLRLWIFLWGSSEIAIRSLSALAGTIAIVMIFLAGETLFDRRTALVAAFLSAISAFQIHFSQEARGYVLLMLFTVVSFLFFIKMLRSGSTRYCVAYAISSLLMGYTHFYSWLFILVQVLYLWQDRSRFMISRRKLIITLAVLFSLLIPQLLLLQNTALNLSERGFWIATPTLTTVVGTLTLFSVAPSWPVGACAVTALCAGLSLGGLLSFRGDGRMAGGSSLPASVRRRLGRIKIDEPDTAVLLVCWLFLPILGAFVVSRLVTPVYWHRYLIGSLPALILVVSRGLVKISSRALSLVALAAVLVLSAPGLYLYYANDVKEQWREAGELVEVNARRNDILIFNRDLARDAFGYYTNRDLEYAVASRDMADLETIVDSLEAKNGATRYWLLISQVDDVEQIEDYVVSTYGRESVLFVRDYVGVSVVLLSPFGVN